MLKATKVMLQREDVEEDVSDLAKVVSVVYVVLSILTILAELVIAILGTLGLVAAPLFGIKTAVVVGVFLGGVGLLFYAGRGGGLIEKALDKLLD